MALSKIWSAFVLISILVASSQLLLRKADQKAIYSKMVTGKAGDTSLTKTYDAQHIPQNITLQLNGTSSYKHGEERIVTNADGSVTTYKEQTADGILTTCKTAV